METTLNWSLLIDQQSFLLPGKIHSNHSKQNMEDDASKIIELYPSITQASNNKHPIFNPRIVRPKKSLQKKSRTKKYGKIGNLIIKFIRLKI